jgi:hypothetical protein
LLGHVLCVRSHHNLTSRLVEQLYKLRQYIKNLSSKRLTFTMWTKRSLIQALSEVIELDFFSLNDLTYVRLCSLNYHCWLSTKTQKNNFTNLLNVRCLIEFNRAKYERKLVL